MTLTSQEQAAARLYSGPYHARVNGCLGGEEDFDDAIRATVAALDSAIAKSRLAGDLVLFRSVGGKVASYMLMAGVRAGSILENDGFVSTSADPVAVRLFASLPPGGLIVRIHVPAGTLALDMTEMSEYPQEREFLLPRGTRLRVLSYDNVARILDTEIA